MANEGHTLFRVMNHNPPIESDFYSHQQLGKPLLDPTKEEMWSGVSMFMDIEDAKAIVRPGRSSQQKWIAELHLVDVAEDVRIERTGRGRDTHYTIWADAGVPLRTCGPRSSRGSREEHDMRTTYQLWDTDDNNLIGTYATEWAALRVVREGVKAHGVEAFRTVALGDEESSGQLRLIAEGMDLVQLASDAPTAHVAESPSVRKAS
jgi:hypothetical protein